jgi:hypothetical protein
MLRILINYLNLHFEFEFYWNYACYLKKIADYINNVVVYNEIKHIHELDYSEYTNCKVC